MKWMGADPTAQLDKVRHLEDRFSNAVGRRWARWPKPTALAYAEAGDTDRAITWYERAMQAGDSSASMKAHESAGQLARAPRLGTGEQGARSRPPTC